ncbi:MAG: ABC transporter permease [Desulfobacterales bacterium]|nr:ABC transporter permease [Desulfobacterales bacterium]
MKLYNISLNNIKRRKAKIVFLLFGLLIGISTIVALLSVSESMGRDIEEKLNKFGANIVLMPKSDTLSLTYGGMTVGGVNLEIKEFNESDIPKIKEIKNSKNLGSVAPKILGITKLNNKDVLLMGVDFEKEVSLKSWWMIQGKIPEKANEIMVGNDVANVFKLSQGDTVKLGKIDYRITAVLGESGSSEDDIIIGDLKSFQKALNKEGKISMVEIAAFCRGCPISDMVLQIAEKFPDGKVTALKQSVMSKMQSVDTFKTFTFGIAVLVVIIGSLLVFVTMMGSVNERTREIGIFRAIGFRKAHVMQIILLEALVVGVLGGIIGYITGCLIAKVFIPLVMEGSSFAGLNYETSIIAIVLSVSLSIIASLYPAFKASNLDPSEALRAL